MERQRLKSGPDGEIRMRLLLLGIGLGVSAVAFATGEFAVRIAGVEPFDQYISSDGLPLPAIRFDPVLGPRSRPGYAGPWARQEFSVVIDERGFRATDTTKASAGAAGVALLGDSCTFGWGLATNETFAAGLAQQAARAGRPIDILNAAYPGDSAVVGPLLLRMQVLRHGPRIVVLGYSGNNAFHITAQSDTERFRFADLRRQILRSRFMAVVASAFASRTSPEIHPRHWNAYRELPLSRWRRVASPSEFEAATREMVSLARERDTHPVLLIFPRAFQVSTRYPYENATIHWRDDPLPARADDGETSLREANALQYSCADMRQAETFLERLHDEPPTWQPFYPSDHADARRLLAEGAGAYVQGRFEPAEAAFRQVLELVPDSPIALYDLASTAFAQGRPEEGLLLLERAQRASCNIFLDYQIALWRVATDLAAPVVDLMLHFQAHDADVLFLDPAHPSAQARDVIAAALWPVVEELLANSPAEFD